MVTDEKWRVSHQRIKDALAVAGKRAALSEQVGVSEGQLSKMLNGELATYCRILAALGLEIHKARYVEALRIVMHEESPKFSCVGAES